MTQDDRNWAVRAKYVSALGTIYSVSLSFFVVLSMMFATLVGQLQKPILIEAATCSLPASISTTIELTPESADNIIDCSGQDITITGTGKLVMKSYSTADSSSANDGGVLLKVANLTIQAGGEISADGQGYVAGAVDGGSATASTGIAAGSGGGHGGAGGSGNTIGGTGNEVGATGGLIGNKDYPITIGGAGGTSGGAGVGGAGGGAIKIESSGTVTIDGKITADGQAGVKSADNQTAGGGGAGGSIWVQAQVLAGSGTVSAKGGGTDDSATYYGGGGGGGRVALICTTSTTFPAGNVSVTFGIGSQNGQVGSLVGPGCKPAEPAILKLYEKNATAGYVDRELSVSDLTTKTAFTFASDLAGANLKLEVEVREKNVSFQNTITNSQVSVLSNKTCLNVPGGISPGSGAVGGGSPGRSGKNGTGGGGAGGQNGGSKAVGGDGGSGVVIVRYVTTDAPATVTGGTVTTSGIYTIHTFTNRGTFATSGNVTVEYLIVGGGGGGGAGWQGGGGGAGGVLSGSVALSAQSYPIIVGAGGQGDRNTSANSNGGNSSFNELVAIGGGRGASENPGGGGAHVASVGGSGGGGSHGSTPLTGAAGTAGQGNSGGSGYTGNPYVGGGGGGAGGAGQNSTSTVVGIGGVGVASSISGSTKYYGAGGGGSRRNSAMAPLISTYCGYVEVATGFSAGKEYKWQARVISSAGIPSGWVQFGDNSISSTDFTVVGVPATMEITEGNNQSVQVGEVVPIRPKVRILDATGFGVPFYTLTGWSVLSGGGLLTHTMVKTDELGYVTTEWTVGTVSGVGNNSIRIANTTPALSATFVASALPGAIASYGVNSENSLSLVNNPFSYTITAKDEYGNIVPFTNNLTVVPVSSHNIANPGLGVLTPYTISFAQAPSEIPWLNASWGYRKKVSFDNTTVNLGVTSVALTDFPVLIQLTSANFDFTKAKANGEDIRMVDADGVTLLPYEIEKWDSAAQTAYIWTRVPKIDADSAVDGMYVYYGNAAASDSQSARNTWESNFKMVLHTSESTGTILNDSTSNNNDGTKLSETEPNAATGVIVGGQSFDGVNDKATVAHSAALNITSAITLESWVYPTEITKANSIIRKGAGGAGKYYLYKNANMFRLAINDVGYNVGGYTIPAINSWYHVVGTYDGANRKIYVNGALQNTIAQTGAIGTNTSVLGVGYNSATAEYVTGALDEVRISSTARTEAWIAATYKTETGDYGFFAAEEAKGSADTTTVYRDSTSGTITIGNGSYSYSESIKLKIYDANGKVGYSNSILFVESTGTCPSVTIDTNQTWNAVDVPGGIFDCRGMGPFSVESGYTLTLNSYDSGDTNRSNDYGATLLVDSLDIETTATITATGTGYIQGTGPGHDADSASAGGSYGGYGGRVPTTTTALPYGSIYTPESLGAAGSGGGGTLGHGGGAMHLAINGDAVINGTIQADGVRPVVSSTGNSGGSAGGSIWLDTVGLSGSGSITTNGTAGCTGCWNHAAGSGGRIAVYYSTNTDFDLENNIQSRGGVDGGGNGGPGTVYVEHKNVDTVGQGILLVDNNNVGSQLAVAIPGVYKFKQIKVKRLGHVEFLADEGNPSASILEIASGSGMVGDSTKPLIKVSGLLRYTGIGRLTVSGVDLGMNGGIEGIQDLTVGDGVLEAGVTIYAQTWFFHKDVTTPANSVRHSFGDVVVKNHGILTMVSYKSGGTDYSLDYGVDLTTTGLMVETGGTITATGTGYIQGTGPGRDALASAGGSYGGYGGRVPTTTTALPYGSIYTPESLGAAGSGGGGTLGHGGGAMHLAINGDAVINGTIQADGVRPVVSSTGNSGGSAGGSIWLDTVGLSGSGSITTNGSAGCTACWNHAAGSGGRIAVYYSTNTDFDLENNIQSRGGVDGGGNGGPGTVYVEHNGVHQVGQGDLRIDNNADVGRGQDFAAGRYALNDVTIGQNVSVWITPNQVVEVTDFNNQPLVGEGVMFILSGNFTLASGASINGEGKGFSSDAGIGKGSPGLGYSGGGGGANGGDGGVGQSDGSNSPATGGTKYGDQLLPLTLGAGGGSSGAGALGGAGGGSFGVLAKGILNSENQYVNGSISIAGTINMDGETGKTGSPGGGGGAGGSILLHGNTCDISGNLSAEGGEGGNSDIDGGSGGGGRVSILYNVGPCDVSGTVSVVEGTPSDPLNYGAQVGQVGTYPPEPNSVPWSSIYKEQFEVKEEGQGALEPGKTLSLNVVSPISDVLGITESVIPVGGIINGTTVTLKADAYDAGAREISPKRLKIQVELKKVNQSFNGTTDIYDSNSITFSGGTPVVLSVTVSNLEMGASYKWRVRTVNIDTHLFSDWQEYGGNASDQADFSITTVVALDLVLSPTTIDLTDRATLTVTAKNSLGNADNTYRGTVLFTSTSDTAELPQSYTFTAEDAGVHVFTNELKFFEAGTFIVTAEDTVNATLIDSASITVNEPIIPAISLGSSATDIVFGSVVTLTWQSNLLTDLSLNQGIGGVSTDGNMQITPPLGTTTYTIQGRRADDSILTASVDITATEGELTPTPIDTPTGTPTITPTGTPTGDTPPITPTGTITPTVTHTIRPTRPPPASCPIITVFTVSNRIIKKGDAITVSWQVQNADKVSVDAFSSSVPKSGSASLVLKKSLDITLFASKGTCKRTSVKHVEVVNSYPWEGAGGLLVGLLIIEMVGLQIGAAQGNIWLALIGLIDRSKKRRPWGVVYNAVTKKFVSRAIVRLWNAKSGVLVDTVVTDANGVFKLTPKKGKYVIKVTAAGFTFPSKLIHSDTDSGYTNIYTGEVIEVVDENDLLLFSIPLDPIKEKRKIVVGHMIRVFFEEFVGVIGPIILMAGFIYSIVVTVMYPLTFNYIILGLYGVVFLIKAYLFLSRPKLFGIVTSVDGKIVSGLEIGLFDKEFNTLVSRTFTNKHGAYNFVVENKAYYLQVMDPRYKVLGGQLSKNGILVKESPGKSGVKLVTENLLVYPVQKLVKGKDLKQ